MAERKRVLLASQEGLYPDFMGGIEVRGAELRDSLSAIADVAVLSRYDFVVNRERLPHSDLAGIVLTPAERWIGRMSWRAGYVLRARQARRRVLQVLECYRPDLIYVNGNSSIMSSVLHTLLAADCPVIAWFGDTFSRMPAVLNGEWRDEVDHTLGRLARAVPMQRIPLGGDDSGRIVLVSNCEFLREWYGPQIPSELEHRMIYDGVDTARFVPAEVRSGRLRYAFFGRIVRLKGFLDFCRAMIELSTDPVTAGDDFEIDIIGDGDDLWQGVQLLRDAGLGHRIVGCGASTREELCARLQLVSVLVAPSHADALPAAIMEAMACEVAVVASDVGGTGELIHHGVHGLLVRPHDQTALVAACRALGSDSQLRHRLGRAARARLLRDFRREDGLAAHVSLIRDMLEPVASR